MTNDASAGGIGFSGLLALLFIALKLCNVIDWSWLWVLSPLWIPVVLLIAIFAAAFIIMQLILLIGIMISLFKK